MREQKLNSLKTYKDKGLRTVIGCVGALSIFSIWALSTMENSVKAELDNSYNAVVSEAWEPWKLTADGLRQEMPEIKWADSHSRFKALCEAYGLDAWMFREIENEYNIREWVLLSIVIAETSWGKTWYWTSSCNNPANNNNNDRWTRVCYDSFREWLIEAAKTLNNSYLGWIQTLGCLSKAGSCKRREDKWYIYASSNGNWERNMLAALNLIYGPELWPIDAERFNVRRVFTIYQ